MFIFPCSIYFLYPRQPCSVIAVQPKSLLTADSDLLDINIDLTLNISNPNYIGLNAKSLLIEIFYEDKLVSESIIDDVNILKQDTTTLSSETIFTIQSMKYFRYCLTPINIDTNNNGFPTRLSLPTSADMEMQVSIEFGWIAKTFVIPRMIFEIPCTSISLTHSCNKIPANNSTRTRITSFVCM